ncbi:pseudouridine synthase [Pontibacter rugosus]|uniref:Pseudouridine synthase n=1 Tax=Pontibacter rugosus TaxID=1745966 RepID=A0ABW3SV31_9BACT
MKALTSSLKFYIVQKLALSNKDAVHYILSGRVLVNGNKGTLSQVLKPEDEVLVDGILVKEPRKTVYIAYYKPRGIESTTNIEIENNLLQASNFPKAIFPVGRLDKASEGLMLLTNDGETLFKILHAEKHQEKEYTVTVDKPLTQQVIDQLSTGIVIMGQKTRPAVVKQLNETIFSITLKQGLNRQIRRMCYKLGYEVQKLVRTRIVNLELGNLSHNEWRFLTTKEIRGLLQEVSE